MEEALVAGVASRGETDAQLIVLQWLPRMIKLLVTEND
jgi:hypothetical protein